MGKPTFEELPTELKILILFQVPDSDTLKSLVLASPGYHNAYLAVRQVLLRCLVKRQYTGFLDLAEALTAVRSKGMNFAYQREGAITLLDKWRRRNEIRELSQSSLNYFSPNNLDEPESLEEIVKLLHFHKMLCFFLEDYSVHAPRPPWMQHDQWERDCLPLHLSASEKHRFLRAMCRFQIAKNIFGETVWCFGPIRCDFCRDDLRCDTCRDVPNDLPPTEWRNVSSCDLCFKMKYWQLEKLDDMADGGQYFNIDHMAYRLFYGTMPPWEYEEMGGILFYFDAKIKAISKEMKNDLRELIKSTPCEWFWDIMPKEQRPPGGAIEIEHDLAVFDLNHSLELAGLGPEFIHGVLHLDRLSRRNVLCRNARAYYQSFIGLDLGLSWDYRFPFIDPADQFETQNFEQFWSTLSPLEQPTVGWKKAWILPHSKEDIFEDALNYDRKSEQDWDWGYAWWDERRLKEWKAPLLLENIEISEASGSAQVS
ncbi:hypothetical protein N7513_001204 [Penicillium frequentans]|nr:hypothetical protein N7513_001204 [Penicillium glabrum]